MLESEHVSLSTRAEESNRKRQEFIDGLDTVEFSSGYNLEEERVSN